MYRFFRFVFWWVEWSVKTCTQIIQRFVEVVHIVIPFASHFAIINTFLLIENTFHILVLFRSIMRSSFLPLPQKSKFLVITIISIAILIFSPSTWFYRFFIPTSTQRTRYNMSAVILLIIAASWCTKNLPPVGLMSWTTSVIFGRLTTFVAVKVFPLFKIL